MGISVTDVDTEAKLPLGFEYTEPADGNDRGEKTWVYVFTDEALVIGDVVEVNGDWGNPYHAIQGNEDTPQKRLLGVAGHAIAISSYGFVQKSGYAPYIKGDGNVAAGDALVAHAAGVADTLDTDQGDMVFGYALTADAADSAATGHSVPVFAGMIKCGV
tara:strand:- start:9487 stop:9966 length:480 start_codon:yes stop_codon:yes gene_type:complete